jgi:glyoxylase-like metal-dependent hydrolase (beta-lactamase superfamily II)
VNRPEIRLARITSDAFQENAYVAQLADRTDCLVVDPGLEPEKIVEYLDREGIVPAAILNTHGHADHIAGNAALKERWPACPLVIGRGDAPKLSDPWANLSAGFGLSLTSPPADIEVDDGETYSAAGFDLEIRAIPGHSAGQVVYLWQARDPAIAFVGDVIFAGSIGRTDFPDGDYEQLLSGIRTKLFTLPDTTILLSGHGPETTVGHERRTNPFVRG